MGKHHPGALAAPKPSPPPFREKNKPREEFSTAPLIMGAAGLEQETPGQAFQVFGPTRPTSPQHFPRGIATHCPDLDECAFA